MGEEQAHWATLEIHPLPHSANMSGKAPKQINLDSAVILASLHSSLPVSKFDCGAEGDVLFELTCTK